jgi:hypothetical protein
MKNIRLRVSYQDVNLLNVLLYFLAPTITRRKTDQVQGLASRKTWRLVHAFDTSKTLSIYLFLALSHPVYSYVQASFFLLVWASRLFIDMRFYWSINPPCPPLLLRNQAVPWIFIKCQTTLLSSTLPKCITCLKFGKRGKNRESIQYSQSLYSLAPLDLIQLHLLLLFLVKVHLG